MNSVKAQFKPAMKADIVLKVDQAMTVTAGVKFHK
jgi:uncharacterized protein YwbE